MKPHQIVCCLIIFQTRVLFTKILNKFQLCYFLAYFASPKLTLTCCLASLLLQSQFILGQVPQQTAMTVIPSKETFKEISTGLIHFWSNRFLEVSWHIYQLMQKIAEARLTTSLIDISTLNEEWNRNIVALMTKDAFHLPGWILYKVAQPWFTL